MSSAPSSTSLQFSEPEGLLARGTIVVIGGRGDTPSLYQRFGNRMASDAYRVWIGTDEHLADLKNVAADAGSVRPLVLLGIDTGALRVAQLIKDGEVDATAAILIGVPGPDDPDTDVDEVDQRASCPNHRLRLADPALATLGTLTGENIPTELRDLTIDIGVPTLALHGINDAVSPLELARTRYAHAPRLVLHTVEDGRHDVLNTQHHRVVAATIVTFLEELRNSGDLTSLVRREAVV